MPKILYFVNNSHNFITKSNEIIVSNHNLWKSMTNPIKSSNNSLRLNTQSHRPKTSSNTSFQENMAGMSNKTVSSISDTFKKGFASVPGAPQLSSVLSQAVNSVGLDMTSGTSDPNSSSLESIQNAAMEKQERLLILQAQNNDMNNEHMAKSNILKNKSDTEKTIIANYK